jgi:hypothetical protein
MSPTPTVTPTVTPSPTPSSTITPTRTVTPSITPTNTPSRTPAPSIVSNTGFTNFTIFNYTAEKGEEYINNNTVNKSLMKLMNNNNILTSYLNYRFTGTLTPLNEVISSGNILPLTQTEKNLINTIFKSGCYVNVNEKTSPQVLNRVFACLFEANNIITNITDIKITNFDDLLRSVNLIVPVVSPTPFASITPSPSTTPSITPSRSPSSSLIPSVTPTRSVTPTATNTPSSTPPPTASLSYVCDQYLFSTDNLTGVVSYDPCIGAATSGVFTNGEIICVQSGTVPTAALPGDVLTLFGTNTCYQ